MFDVVNDYVNELWEPFINPQKRVFLGYLGSSIIIAILLIFFQFKAQINKSDASKLISRLFQRRIWFAPSAFADYKILFISRFIMLSITPHLISTIALTTLMFEWLHIIFDGRIGISGLLPNWVVVVLFSLTLFLIDDWSKFILHKALHRIPLLWCFHKVHHTAEVLTPFTVYRTHPVEAILFGLRSVVSKSIVLAVFVYFFASQVELFSIIGVNIFLFIFNIVGANLRHSHIWLSYGRILGHVFISPAQHQIHHSIDEQHRDKNFGAVLAIWDWMDGSLWTTSLKREKLKFGALGASSKSHNMRYIFLIPFYEFVNIIFRNRRISISTSSKKQISDSKLKVSI
mgnify:CR=1 FL=1